MTVEDSEVLALFDRAVRPMRPALPDDLLGGLRQTQPPGSVRSVGEQASAVTLEVAGGVVDARGRRRWGSALVIAAAAVLVIAGLAVMQRDRAPEAPAASSPDISATGRASGSISDARSIDFSPWLVGAPAWPSGQPSSYAVFKVAALEGWTQLDNLGSHTIGQGDGYVWSSNVNDPEGREFHLVVTSETNYPTVVSNGQPVDINGIAGTAGEGEVSWPLDAAHTAVVTEFGTTDVERAVALARQLSTTTVSSLSSQQPAGSVADAVPDVAAQFAGSVDGMAWSLDAARNGVTIIVDGIVREFRGGVYDPASGIEVLEAGNNDHCVFVAAYLPAGSYIPRLALSDGTVITLPTRPVDEVSDAFAACVPYALDAVRVELVDGSGSVAGVHDLAAPYLRPSSGGTQTRIAVGDVPAT